MHRSFSPMLAAFLLVILQFGLFGGPAGTTAQTPEGFLPLFNGKDLTGWHVMSGGRFSVKDGILVLDRGGGWLRSDQEYQDFELRIEFRFVAPQSNSGIFFRARNHPGPNVGYQVQTKDDASIGSVYVRGLDRPNERKDAKLVEKALKPGNAWQEYAITAKGPVVEVRLNGELVNRADKLSTEKGHLGLQGEGGHLEFRSLLIKPLPAAP